MMLHQSCLSDEILKLTQSLIKRQINSGYLNLFLKIYYIKCYHANKQGSKHCVVEYVIQENISSILSSNSEVNA